MTCSNLAKFTFLASYGSLQRESAPVLPKDTMIVSEEARQVRKELRSAGFQELFLVLGDILHELYQPALDAVHLPLLSIERQGPFDVD